MNAKYRLGKIEQTLRARNCEACAAREAQCREAATDEEWLQVYFGVCRACGSQRTWRDLALTGSEPKWEGLTKSI